MLAVLYMLLGLAAIAATVAAVFYVSLAWIRFAARYLEIEDWVTALGLMVPMGIFVGLLGVTCHEVGRAIVAAALAYFGRSG